MNYTAYNSISYALTYGRRSLSCLVLLQLLTAPGSADTVYQWTDAAGTVHFSDTAPSDLPAHRHELEPLPERMQAAQGLRPGEMASLQAIEQRLENQQRSARLARQRNDRLRAEHRKDCRERRARQQRIGNHPARREQTIYLRRNCW